MSFLSEIKGVVTSCGLPVETGVFKGKAPNEYVVVTPMGDSLEVHADNRPGYAVEEARLSLFVKGNYTTQKKKLMKELLDRDFTITDGRYIGHENDTDFHHYAIDVAKHYEMEE